MSLDVFKNSKFVDNDDEMFANLVKLLAEEDITSIVSKEFPTAFFDIKRRMCGFPMWEKMNRAVRALLRFHEVGHAKYSDEESFHDFVEGKYPARLAGIINICEDDRIDRLMVKAFPGAKKIYLEGYKYVFNRFFKDVNYEECSLADKFNIDSKGKLIPFVAQNDTEAKLYFKFKNTQTAEEAIAVAHEIYEYCKQQEQQKKQEKQEQQEKQQQEQQQKGDPNPGRGSPDESQGEEGEEEQQPSDGEETSGEEDSGDTTDGGETTDGDKTDHKNQEKMEPTGGSDSEGSDNTDENSDDFSKTQSAFKKAEQDLVEESTDEVNPSDQLRNPYNGKPLSTMERIIVLKTKKKNVISYKDVRKTISSNINNLDKINARWVY
jgi:hypothetical protein